MPVEPPTSASGQWPRPRLVVLDGAQEDVPSRSPQLPTVVHVVATRPDAVTLAPVVTALEREATFRQVVLHTGQHTGSAMVEEMFADLALAPPEHHLGVSSGSHATQTARALTAGETVLREIAPAAVVVTGASNSALGVALAAVKLGIPVARLEAGLRERDWSAPEEVNRVMLDTMADTLFAPTQQAADALAAEGIAAGRVHVVGSTAVDSLRRSERRARDRAVWQRYGLSRGTYVLVTLHRPANVDDDERLARIVEALATLASRVPVVFPMHPRTRERLRPMGDDHRLLAAGVLCGPPLAYIDFLSLQMGAGAVVTDSSTVQEESTALGVRCLTLRATTERAITLTHGTNTLVGADPRDVADLVLEEAEPVRCAVPLWDGGAGGRIAYSLVASYALVRRAGTS